MILPVVFQINPSVLKIYSHPVTVKELNNVVSITTLDVNTPSSPILRDMTQQATVVPNPSITSIAKKKGKKTQSEITTSESAVKKQEEFEEMKKKTRNMMFGLAAVFVLAVAGVAAYKAMH